jgi:hypothetical protein
VRPARVVDVKHLGGFRLRLTFTDGLVRDLDFDGFFEGGAFEPLRDMAVFIQVTVDPVAGTIRWPNDVDLDPDVLHGDERPVADRAPVVLNEYRLRSAG